MKRFAYTTMLLLCLTISKTKAQTSASMGLNGVVESYEISGKGNSYSEYARFNPDTKKLVYYTIDDENFRVKGNRPTSFSNKIDWNDPWDHDGENWRSYTHNFIYSGKLVSKYAYIRKIRYVVRFGSPLWNRPGDHWSKPHKILKTVCTYKYTKNDIFGNWIARVATSNGESWTETRDITYNKGWLDKQLAIAEKKNLEKFEKHNDLKGLEEYLQSSDILESTKVDGKELWNKMVLSEARVHNIDSVQANANNPLATSETIEKMKETWSSYELKNVIASNSIKRIENFIDNKFTTRSAADSARTYWNELVWPSVSGTDATYQQIAEVATHRLANKAKANKEWKRVEELYYNKVVMKHTNYHDVENDKKFCINERRVIESDKYILLTKHRCDSLRNLEIALYMEKANNAAATKDYEKAVAYAQHVLSMDNNYQPAIDISAENGYQHMRELKKKKVITDADYAKYINENPRGGEYTTKICDEYALILAKRALKGNGAFSEIMKLPMSEKTREKVISLENSLENKIQKRLVRKSLVRMGAKSVFRLLQHF